MRFYEEWNGFIWEYNSVGEYFKAQFERLIGSILGIFVLIGIFYFLYWLGS